MNIYYTAREGRRNRNGHTTTRGEVYIIRRGDNTTEDALEKIGEYVHVSGGEGIESSILAVCKKAGINTNGGYSGRYRETINLIKI